MRSLVIVTALLAACGGRGSSPPADPAAPDPADPAHADPVQPEVTLVPGRSLGPVHYGMSEAEVVAQLGDPEEVYADGAVRHLLYFSRGLEVNIARDTVTALHANAGVPDTEDSRQWTAFPLRTAEGITWDATYDDVVAALGPPQRSDEIAESDIPERWAEYAGVIYAFRLADGALISVYVAEH